MSVTHSWTLLPASLPGGGGGGAVVGATPTVPLSERIGLGHGITRPFRRDRKQDFAHSGGADLVQACVGQVLGTRAAGEGGKGELPWRTEFGSLVHLMRFRNNDAVLRELGRAWAREALQRWEPRARVRDVIVDRPDGTGEEALRTVILRVLVDVVRGTGDNVVLRGVEVTVPLV